MNSVRQAALAATLVAAGIIATAASAHAASYHMGDRHYLAKTAQGLMSEIELGRVAQQRAGDPRVKAYGKRMVSDHSKDLAQVKQLAAQGGVKLPDKPGLEQRIVARRLKKLSGTHFDSAYMSHEVSDHKDDIKDARREARGGKDAGVKQLAGKALPELETHLRLAQQIAGR
jgi:putative membrane protein